MALSLSASAAFGLLLFVGCAGFPDVTYADDPGVDPAAQDGAALPLTDAARAGDPAPRADAGAHAEAGPPPSSEAGPPDPRGPDAAPPPAGTCDKNPCFGAACGIGDTCARCKDACKGQTKKCCADDGEALSCVAESSLCAGETP